jgi:hypothetical protein
MKEKVKKVLMSNVFLGILLVAGAIISLIFIFKGVKDQSQELKGFKEVVETNFAVLDERTRLQEQGLSDLSFDVRDLKGDVSDNEQGIKGLLESSEEVDSRVDSLVFLVDSLETLRKEDRKSFLNRIAQINRSFSEFKKKQEEINSFYKTTLGSILEGMEGLEEEIWQFREDSVSEKIVLDSIHRITIPAEAEEEEEEGRDF